MSLTIKITATGKDVYLTLEGVLDENCQMPEFREPILGKLEIDLENLTMVNSLGCRLWSQWIKGQVQARAGIHLVKCSPAIVNQVNILDGFLPANGQVDSFFVPYYCEGCGHEDRVLLSRGKEFDGEGLLSVSEDLPCPKCKAIMSIEVVKDRYFKFLAKRNVA